MSEGPQLAKRLLPSRRTWNELLELPALVLLALRRGGIDATLGLLAALVPAGVVIGGASVALERLVACLQRPRWGFADPGPTLTQQLVAVVAMAVVLAIASALVLALVQCAPLAAFAGAITGRRATVGDAVAGFPRLLALSALTTLPLVAIALLSAAVTLALGEPALTVVAPFGMFAFAAWLPVAHVGFLTLGQVHVFVRRGTTTRDARRAAAALGGGREWFIFYASIAPALALLLATPNALGSAVLPAGVAKALGVAGAVATVLLTFLLRAALAAAAYAVAARAAHDDTHIEATQ